MNSETDDEKVDVVTTKPWNSFRRMFTSAIEHRRLGCVAESVPTRLRHIFTTVVQFVTTIYKALKTSQVTSLYN